MSAEANAFERDEPVEFQDVHGFVVLLDSDMKEAGPRQDAQFSWRALPGGATYQITSSHEFDLTGLGKEICYLAVGGEDHLMFISPVVSAPVRSGIFTIRAP